METSPLQSWTDSNAETLSAKRGRWRTFPDAEILISIDKLRAGEELFRVLNIGVPVGSALVTAVALNGNAGRALLAIASHAALSYIPWSAIQTGRTEKAAFAASLLAIASGWNAPKVARK